MMETQTRGKGTIDHGLRGSVGTLDNVNPTRLSKQSQAVPLHTGIFMDKRMTARHGFKLQKLERPIAVRNIDGINNSRGVITYQMEANVYYKSHIERIRMDVCDLGKME